MSPFQGRRPGMVGGGARRSEAFVGVIADGHHVHPASFKIAFAARPHDRMHADHRRDAARGGRPRQFLLQGRNVARVDGCLRLEDGTIAGSVLRWTKRCAIASARSA